MLDVESCVATVCEITSGCDLDAVGVADCKAGYGGVREVAADVAGLEGWCCCKVCCCFASY